LLYDEVQINPVFIRGETHLLKKQTVPVVYIRLNFNLMVTYYTVITGDILCEYQFNS